MRLRDGVSGRRERPLQRRAVPVAMPFEAIERHSSARSAGRLATEGSGRLVKRAFAAAADALHYVISARDPPQNPSGAAAAAARAGGTHGRARPHRAATAAAALAETGPAAGTSLQSAAAGAWQCQCARRTHCAAPAVAGTRCRCRWGFHAGRLGRRARGWNHTPLPSRCARVLMGALPWRHSLPLSGLCIESSRLAKWRAKRSKSSAYAALMLWACVSAVQVGGVLASAILVWAERAVERAAPHRRQPTTCAADRITTRSIDGAIPETH